MENMRDLYRQHLAELQTRVRTLLEREQLDALLIPSGEPSLLYLDDRYTSFKVNPQFKAWIPVTHVAHCWLWLDGVNKPKVWFYTPIDYWHSVEPLPDCFWTEEVELYPLQQKNEICRYLPASLTKVAYLGENEQQAGELGISKAHINPTSILDYLHYYRAYKTDYELACMREAQKIAVRGHFAARDAFMARNSEFSINMHYLSATGQRDTDVPYDNIVALNEHAAVLHYTHLKSQAPNEFNSFLLDAGAEFNGYAADITRTYATAIQNDFAALITDLDQEQQDLIQHIQTGVRFTEYNLQMHQRIAKLLIKHDLLQGLSQEAIVEKELTGLFFPHGLGHLLGLQVHDVAGFMQDETGTHLSAPKAYSALRCTRILQPRMVVTIEPGIYFIETLLEPWRDSPQSKHFNWHKIDMLKKCGGIRIEDNIVLQQKGIENITRDAFSNAI